MVDKISDKYSTFSPVINVCLHALNQDADLSLINDTFTALLPIKD